MKDRIREIRNAEKLNQTDFGKIIGVAQTTIAGYENGSRTVPNVAIIAICDKFGVNETWLRTGAGEMYASKSRQQEMADMAKSLMNERPESFRSALVTALLRFDPDGPEWEVLERIYDSVAREASKNDPGK